MIFEVRFWQRELRHLAARLRQQKDQRVWRRASYAALEKYLMLGAYAIRKMREAFFPVEASWQATLLEYRRKSKRMPKCFWPDIEAEFDLEHPIKVRLPVLELCNQLIHSYVFTPSFKPDRQLHGIFFASDRAADKKLYHLEIDAVIRLLELVSRSKTRGWLHIGPECNRVVLRS